MSGRVAVALACLAIAPGLARQQVTFRSSVDIVQVPVSVTDKNKPVANLSAVDFELFDNDVKQEITLTTIDSMPTDVTFLMDTSGSVNGKALDRIKLDLQEMANLLQPNDRVRLVSFASDSVDVFGLLPGGATLDFNRMSAGGTTSLYDALVSVLAAYPGTERPHMIFAVTDGRDNSSFASARHVVDVARTSSAVLLVALVQSSNPLVREGGKIEAIDPLAAEQSGVAIPQVPGANIMTSVTPGGPSAPAPGPHVIWRNVGPYRGMPNRPALGEATAATGGLVYSDTSRTPIPQLFRRVLDDFRASYVLAFAPSGVDRGGTHTITVRMKNKSYTVRARKNYEAR